MQLMHISNSPVILSIACLIVLLSSCSKKTEVTEDIRPVRAIQLTADSQQVLAEYAGSVQPRIEARMGFRVGGKISARKVDVGSEVKAGQLLMQLDAEDLQLAHKQAQGNFHAAESALESANNELKRYQELRKTNLISASLLDAKMAAQAAAQGSFDQAQAQLKLQSNQAGYANLVAKRDGVVTSISAEVGQVVAAGESVLSVAQLSELEVVVSIPENSVNIIKRANDIKIHLWSNPQEPLEGKLREVSPVADAATRSFTAKVSVINPSIKMRAILAMGMTASVQFGLSTPSSFIKAPLTALLQEKGVTSVWIVEKGLAKLVPVQIGGIKGNDVLLTSGVVVGQTLVTAGVHLLKPNQRVNILEEATKKEELAAPYLSAQTLLKAKDAGKSVEKAKDEK